MTSTMVIVRTLKVVIIELPLDKTNKSTCAPNEDSDQPGPSVFAVGFIGS